MHGDRKSEGRRPKPKPTPINTIEHSKRRLSIQEVLLYDKFTYRPNIRFDLLDDKSHSKPHRRGSDSAAGVDELNASQNKELRDLPSSVHSPNEVPSSVLAKEPAIIVASPRPMQPSTEEAATSIKMKVDNGTQELPLGRAIPMNVSEFPTLASSQLTRLELDAILRSSNRDTSRSRSGKASARDEEVVASKRIAVLLEKARNGTLMQPAVTPGKVQATGNLDAEGLFQMSELSVGTGYVSSPDSHFDSRQRPRSGTQPKSYSDAVPRAVHSRPQSAVGKFALPKIRPSSSQSPNSSLRKARAIEPNISHDTPEAFARSWLTESSRFRARVRSADVGVRDHNIKPWSAIQTHDAKSMKAQASAENGRNKALNKKSVPASLFNPRPGPDEGDDLSTVFDSLDAFALDDFEASWGPDIGDSYYNDDHAYSNLSVSTSKHTLYSPTLRSPNRSVDQQVSPMKPSDSQVASAPTSIAPVDEKPSHLPAISGDPAVLKPKEVVKSVETPRTDPPTRVGDEPSSNSNSVFLPGTDAVPRTTVETKPPVQTMSTQMLDLQRKYQDMKRSGMPDVVVKMRLKGEGHSDDDIKTIASMESQLANDSIASSTPATTQGKSPDKRVRWRSNSVTCEEDLESLSNHKTIDSPVVKSAALIASAMSIDCIASVLKSYSAAVGQLSSSHSLVERREAHPAAFSTKMPSPFLGDILKGSANLKKTPSASDSGSKTLVAPLQLPSHSTDEYEEGEILDVGPTVAGKEAMANARIKMNLDKVFDYEEEYEADLARKMKAWAEFTSFVTEKGREIPLHRIRMTDKLGRGKFAAVYDGILRPSEEQLAREKEMAVAAAVAAAGESPQGLLPNLGSSAGVSTKNRKSLTAPLKSSKSFRQPVEPVPPAALTSSIILSAPKPVALKIAQFVGNNEVAIQNFTLVPANSGTSPMKSSQKSVIVDGSKSPSSTSRKTPQSPKVSKSPKSPRVNSARSMSAKVDKAPAIIPPEVSSKEFLREVAALHLLNSHPNIVYFEGVTLSPLCIVLERMDGNLANFLESSEWQYKCNLKARLGILANIASGLTFMHKYLYIHRDVKPHNILLNELGDGTFVAKICDLGTAVKLSDSQEILTGACGTSGYTAPEIYLLNEYSLPVDVFAFGVVVWEVFSQRRNSNPVTGLDPRIATAKLLCGTRPEFGPEHPVLVQEISSRCWVTESHSRPLISSVDALLTDIYRNEDKLSMVYDRPFAKSVLRIVSNVRRRSLEKLPQLVTGSSSLGKSFDDGGSVHSDDGAVKELTPTGSEAATTARGRRGSASGLSGLTKLFSFDFTEGVTV